MYFSYVGGSDEGDTGGGGGGPSSASAVGGVGDSVDRMITALAERIISQLVKKEDLKIKDGIEDRMEEVSDLMEGVNGECGFEPVKDKFKKLSDQQIKEFLEEAGLIIEKVQDDQKKGQITPEELEKKSKEQDAALSLFTVAFKLSTEKIMARDGKRAIHLIKSLKDQEKIMKERKRNFIGSGMENRLNKAFDVKADPIGDDLGDGFCITSTGGGLTTIGTIALAAIKAPACAILASGGAACGCCCLAWLCGGKDCVAGAMEGTQPTEYIDAKKEYLVVQDGLKKLHEGQDDSLRQAWDEAKKIWEKLSNSSEIRFEYKQLQADVPWREFPHLDISEDMGGPRSQLMGGAADAAGLSPPASQTGKSVREPLLPKKARADMTRCLGISIGSLNSCCVQLSTDSPPSSPK